MIVGWVDVFLNTILTDVADVESISHNIKLSPDMIDVESMAIAAEWKDCRRRPRFGWETQVA